MRPSSVSELKRKKLSLFCFSLWYIHHFYMKTKDFLVIVMEISTWRLERHVMFTKYIALESKLVSMHASSRQGSFRNFCQKLCFMKLERSAHNRVFFLILLYFRTKNCIVCMSAKCCNESYQLMYAILFTFCCQNVKFSMIFSFSELLLVNWRNCIKVCKVKDLVVVPWITLNLHKQTAVDSLRNHYRHSCHLVYKVSVKEITLCCWKNFRKIPLMSRKLHFDEIQFVWFLAKRRILWPTISFSAINSLFQIACLKNHLSYFPMFKELQEMNVFRKVSGERFFHYHFILLTVAFC